MLKIWGHPASILSQSLSLSWDQEAKSFVRPTSLSLECALSWEQEAKQEPCEPISLSCARSELRDWLTRPLLGSQLRCHSLWLYAIKSGSKMGTFDDKISTKMFHQSFSITKNRLHIWVSHSCTLFFLYFTYHRQVEERACLINVICEPNRDTANQRKEHGLK